ncbi:hypothetical protein JXR93_02545 [bacterium]|nr:hypothetical protein [bacterium]
MRIISILFLLFSIIVWGGDYKIIINIENKVESLSKAEISQLFMKKTGKWDSGDKVNPVDQGESSSVRGAFSKDIHGKSTEAIKKIWMEQMYSGRSNPPIIKNSDREVIEYVKNKVGAIGYVSSSAPIDGVKELKVK